MLGLIGCMKAPKSGPANGGSSALDTSESRGVDTSARGADTAARGADTANTGLRDDSAAPSDTAAKAEELRGIWVTRWTYSCESDVETIMEHIANAGLNAVYSQVRGRHYAFYASAHEPWAI